MTKFHQNYLTNQIFCGIIVLVIIYHAGVVKLADTQDLGSCAARCAGSSPVTRTNSKWLECVKTTYSSHFLHFDISDEGTFFRKNANFFAKVPTENAN